MQNNHGINVTERPTSISIPVLAQVGVPFVIGAAPVQSTDSPAAAGMPVICTNWQEAVEKLGYSDDWSKYNLCEFMYSHFVLYGRQPVIFCNLLNPDTMNTTVSASDFPVVNRKALLPLEAINDTTLVVKEGSTVIAKGTDYDTFYADGNLVVELLQGGSAYNADTLNIAYKAVTPASVTATLVAAGLENIESCLAATGMTPDIIVAPGYSKDVQVAAVMATKCKINGMFSAKALIDISTAPGTGARTYQEALVIKQSLNLVDENQIVCWPMVKLGDMQFHLSTQIAGLMAATDTENGNVPYESPSNKALKCDSVILEDGTSVWLTHPQANTVEAAGIVTALRFIGGLTAWGNYTACYPVNADVKDFFIPVSRMFDFISNTVIRTFWSKLDTPMNERLVQSILDTCNIWLNGLVGAGYLLGARVEFNPAENPETDLAAGILRIHIYIAPPPPFKEANFILEYDVSYLASMLQ